MITRDQLITADEEAWRLGQLAAIIYAGCAANDNAPTPDQAVRYADRIMVAAMQKVEERRHA